jgi:membrane peptidoglycan carboxypeptidase
MASQHRNGSTRTTRSAASGRHAGRTSIGNSHSEAARRNGPRSNRSRSGQSSNGRNNHSAPKGKRPKRHLVLKWVLGIIVGLLALGIGAFAYAYATTELPSPEKIAMAEKTTVYYADGTTPMGTFATQNREIIGCQVLPKYVGQSIVASENQSFYQDKGIDLKGIARAFLNNVSGGARQGGSTITQQYAERYYMGDTHTYSGKAKEALLALKITQTQSKDEVLCNYMNTIYLGRGAYGIQAAAKAYFNKDAKDLTMPEAAMLAGIIPAPSNWDPAVNPKQADLRFNRVISIMKSKGYISASDAKNAQPPQTVSPQSQQNSYAGPNGYLLQMVRDELTQDGTFSKDDLDTGGYSIVTTIDKGRQDLMFNVASPSQGGHGIVPQGVEIGGMNVNPKDGSIIALYAGDDYLSKQLNNATQASYEPGSTMKPFALMATVQSGVSLNTTFNGNSPRIFPNITAPVQNFANQSFGYTNLYNATANSVNTVYMDVQDHLGAKKVAQTAQAAGVSPKLVTGDNPFTVLGNDSVHVSDIARAYATFANQGNRPTLHIVSGVKDTEGKEMYRAPTATERVFTADDTALVTKALTGTVQYGTATEARRIGKAVAGKSGTANDSTAGSFAGFTPSSVTVFAMWCPGPDGRPQEIPRLGAGYGNGSDYPVHLFTEYMRQSLNDVPNEPFPAARDDGKIGGPDGTWGVGAGWSKGGSTTPRFQRMGNQGGANGTNGNTGTGTPATPSAPQPSTPTTPPSSNGGEEHGGTASSGQ